MLIVVYYVVCVGGDQISISFNSNKRQSTFALKIDGRHF